MADAAGTATWTYDPVTGQPATVDGPFENDTIAYTWDAAGHRLSTTLAGAAVATYTYDTQGRMATVTPGSAGVPPAPFSRSYLGASSQVASLAMPVSVTTTRPTTP